MPTRCFPGVRAAVVAALVAAAPALQAAPPDLAALESAREPADEMLGQMRGRFVAGGGVVQFGVSMVTRWSTSSGEMLSASADLRIDRSGGGTPIVQFEPTLSIVSGSSATSPQPGSGNSVHAGAGLGAASGVVQVIQVAGDHNSVTHNASVLVSSSPVLDGGGGGSPGAGEHTRTSASGASVSVALRPNELSVQATVPDVGSALQRLRGARLPGSAGGGLLQSTRVAGDLQTVDSSVVLRVQVADPGSRRLLAAPHLMRQGIRAAGAF